MAEEKCEHFSKSYLNVLLPLLIYFPRGQMGFDIAHCESFIQNWFWSWLNSSLGLLFHSFTPWIVSVWPLFCIRTQRCSRIALRLGCFTSATLHRRVLGPFCYLFLLYPPLATSRQHHTRGSKLECVFDSVRTSRRRRSSREQVKLETASWLMFKAPKKALPPSLFSVLMLRSLLADGETAQKYCTQAVQQ